MKRLMGPHGPYYPDEIEAVWKKTRRSVAEYDAHPSAGRFEDTRQQPCSTCGEPTYSLRGLCAAHRKGDT